MREPNKNYVYSLEDLTSEELKDIYNATFEPSKMYKCLYYSYTNNNWVYSNTLDKSISVNAKELFYTLKNVQVDCSELSEEQIKEMANVFEKSGYKQWIVKDALKVIDDYTYLRIGLVNEFYINRESHTKTTITYEKFMELFAEPEYEVKYIAEAPKEDKPIQYQIGIDAIGIAEKNMTIDECLAIARFNITKYSYRKKNQDLEDYTKIIAYANWTIKLLNKK